MKMIEPSLVIHEARSGVKALQYLDEAKKNRTLPSLIVLDVNMPLMGGKETLVAIKNDDSLVHIPVVIFSTASTPHEKEFFEEHQVEFFTKPCSLSEMQLIAEKLLNYCS